jgi:hypothetical protein
MENVSFVKIIESDGTEVEHAIIDRGNGEFTSMLKSVYDAQFPSKPKKTISQSE